MLRLGEKTVIVVILLVVAMVTFSTLSHYSTERILAAAGLIVVF